MNRRNILRNILKEAWEYCIKNDYHKQRINSERSLQASLWSRLNSKLSKTSRRMFIEPCLQIESSKGTEKKYPDLVICNRKEIIGIIEMKYQPRIRPTCKKDIGTLMWIIANREDLFVSNTRFRGLEADNNKYKLAKDILFVWAGIHIQCGIKLKKEIKCDTNDSFLVLHAETMHNHEANISYE